MANEDAGREETPSLEEDDTNPPNKITNGYGRILQNKILSDVTFIVGKEKRVITAHKIFLASASDIFEDMFRAIAPSLKLQSQFKIPDIEPHIFEILLKYMYNQDIQYYLETETENVFAIFSAAKRFNLHDLVTKANNSLKSCVSKDTALQVFKWATFYNHDLKETALQEICRSAHEILESKEFLRVDIQDLEKFIGLDDLAAKDEMQIFEALIRWAEEQCKRGGAAVTARYCRSYLEKVIPLIRFPQISESYFESCVGLRGILSGEERAYMSCYYVNPDCERSEASLGGLQFNTKPKNYWKAPPWTDPAVTLTSEQIRALEINRAIRRANHK